MTDITCGGSGGMTVIGSSLRKSLPSPINPLFSLIESLGAISSTNSSEIA
jgi:hypothetical protein